MAVQVAIYEFEQGVTTAALLTTWMAALTITSVLGMTAIPKSNTKATIVFSYKDA